MMPSSSSSFAARIRSAGLASTKALIGSSLELINTGADLVNPISKLLLLSHLGLYRAATPTHCRIITDSEIFRQLRQRPIAKPLYQIQRYFPRLILPSPHAAKYLLPRYFVLTHDFIYHTLRSHLYDSALIAWMLPSGWRAQPYDPLDEFFAA